MKKIFKRILKEIDELLSGIITYMIMESVFNGASRWQRLKWKLEDFFKRN